MGLDSQFRCVDVLGCVVVCVLASLLVDDSGCLVIIMVLVFVIVACLDWWLV